jgi:hypothetical protein
MRAPDLLLDALLAVIFSLLVLLPRPAQADPAKYPQFAQQSLPADVKPEFTSVETLAADIMNGAKPLIVDVRTTEEFNEAHILGAVSAPLEHFRDYIKSIPRDRLTILY